jgi:PTS system mannose-specific IIB component/fructoselysine and glucoselysine-specific PTS system IIB component
VDDEVAASDWEQELYRMGVPPDMDIYFDAVDAAATNLDRYQEDDRRGLLLTGDIATMARLVEATGDIRRVNVGGIHHRPGRTQRLRYVFLTPVEEAQLRALAANDIEVTAQDVPAARPIPLDEILSGDGA